LTIEGAGSGYVYLTNESGSGFGSGSETLLKIIIYKYTLVFYETKDKEKPQTNLSNTAFFSTVPVADPWVRYP
jgi:hypothetical protein